MDNYTPPPVLWSIDKAEEEPGYYRLNHFTAIHSCKHGTCALSVTDLLRLQKELADTLYGIGSEANG